jgi:hypothetical protein
MPNPLEQMLLTVWRQTLIDGAKNVAVEGQRYPVCATARRKLKQVDFRLDGRELRGLEQNRIPNRGGQCQRKKVMQFLENHRYFA